MPDTSDPGPARHHPGVGNAVRAAGAQMMRAVGRVGLAPGRRSARWSGRRPPRVLLAVTDPFSTVLIQGQAVTLVAAGAEVAVVTSPGKRARAMADDEGATYFPVPMEREIALRADLKSYLSLLRLLRCWRPDLVVAGTPKAGLLVLAAAATVGVPGRVFSLLGLRSATLHGPKRAMVRAAERASALLATDVLCNSYSLRDQAVTERIIAPERTCVVGAGSCTGIDLERFRPRSPRSEAARELRRNLGCSDEDLLVGFVGRLNRDKGLPELAEAWALVRDDHTRLALIGPDEHDPECAGALRSLEADPTVGFTGLLDDMPTVYEALDLMVLPTLREGLGNVLIEAAATGTAVVTTAVTGTTDVVIDGETGTLVPPYDPTALAEAMRTYLRDPELRAAHGEEGRRRTERLFDSKLVLRGQAEYFDSILRRHMEDGLHPSRLDPEVERAPDRIHS